jgi:hypothetical protein
LHVVVPGARYVRFPIAPVDACHGDRIENPELPLARIKTVVAEHLKQFRYIGKWIVVALRQSAMRNDGARRENEHEASGS